MCLSVGVLMTRPVSVPPILPQVKIEGAALNIPGGIVAAAKVLNEATEESSKDLYSEAAISAQLGDHPHVVSIDAPRLHTNMLEPAPFPVCF